MKNQAPLSYALSSLLDGLFKPAEHIYLAHIDGTKFHQHKLSLSKAKAWVLQNQAKPNLYFSPSVLSNKSTDFSRMSFINVRGFCLKPFFETGIKAKD